jgi:hypothetical protein
LELIKKKKEDKKRAAQEIITDVDINDGGFNEEHEMENKRIRLRKSMNLAGVVKEKVP